LARDAANMDAVLVAAARLAAATLLKAPRGAKDAAAAGSTARAAAMAPYRSREIKALLTVRFIECLLRAGGVSFTMRNLGSVLSQVIKFQFTEFRGRYSRFNIGRDCENHARGMFPGVTYRIPGIHALNVIILLCCDAIKLIDEPYFTRQYHTALQ
jgi:hypothetical protein